MLILDTHVWVWWVHAAKELGEDRIQWLDKRQSEGLGINTISLWEVAKLVEYERLTLPCSIEEWMHQALSYPGIQVADLSPTIAVESTRLPGNFHKDPADQIIVASSRVLGVQLVTFDRKILDYPHVDSIWP